MNITTPTFRKVSGTSHAVRNTNRLCLAFLVGAFACRLGGDSSASVSYLFLACFALYGRPEAVLALTFSWLFTMLNPAIGGDATAGAAGRYIVIAAAGLSTLVRSNKTWRISKQSAKTLTIGLLILLHSTLVSEVADISVLKCASWLIVMLILLSAWSAMPIITRAETLRRIYLTLIAVLIGSVPLLLVPEIGYLRNGSGFQGLLNHPQAFGPLASLVAALTAGRILDSRRPAWWQIALFILCLVLLMLSEARTAFFGFVIALLATVLFRPLISRTRRMHAMPGLYSKKTALVICIALIASLFLGPLIVNSIAEFVYKRSATTSLLEAAEASRGALVNKMLSNITLHPLTGIGFGVASEPQYMEVDRNNVLGVPLSAPVEKGMMPVAIVEELGIPLALALFFWFLTMLRRAAMSSSEGMLTSFTVVMINFGESMFFSVGGMGMILLILFTAASTQAKK